MEEVAKEGAEDQDKAKKTRRRRWCEVCKKMVYYIFYKLCTSASSCITPSLGAGSCARSFNTVSKRTVINVAHTHVDVHMI